MVFLPPLPTVNEWATNKRIYGCQIVSPLGVAGLSPPFRTADVREIADSYLDFCSGP